MVIKRAIYSQIKEHLATPDVFTLIIGPRQAGKTYVMSLLRQELEERGEKTLSLNMDIGKDTPLFESQERLVQAIRLAVGPEKGFVFLDEIQRKQNAGLFLKGLYDMKLPYKFIISGSGSLELKEKIHESLPGRKRLFELTTISFEEFINFKTNYAYEGKLAGYYEVYADSVKTLFEEYLNFGGYPRVVLASTTEKKQEEIDDIYKSYLERDIESLLNIQKSDKFTQLVRVLAAQAGNLVNIAELSSTLGISMQTVSRYLWFLEKTFIIRKVTPFFKNIRKEITKSPQYYFLDLGLKNYSINQFGTATSFMPQYGFLFQNFVYNCLREYLKTTATTINFWRTREQTEVDFVLNTGLAVVPVEVKYTVLTSAQTSRSFKSFLSRYRPKHAYVIHLGAYHETLFESTTIHCIPFYSCQTIKL